MYKLRDDSLVDASHGILYREMFLDLAGIYCPYVRGSEDIVCECGEEWGVICNYALLIFSPGILPKSFHHFPR